MHGGGGVPSSMGKGGTNASQSSSSSQPPPPIPARRLASHPPAASGSSSSKSDGHQHHSLSVKEKDTAESHSAPSSPTEKDGSKHDGTMMATGAAGGGSSSNISPRHSNRSPNNQRPKSVVVDLSSGLNYAQVQFTNGHPSGGGRPRIQQRRNTKYTSIAYQPENAGEKKSSEETDGHSKSDVMNDQQQTSSASASGRNHDRHHHHHHHHHQPRGSSPRASPVPSSENAATYDVPPPVPMRMDLPEDEVVNSGSGNSATPEVLHRRVSSDPFHSTGGADPFSSQADPFSSQDPFSGGAGGAWEDPAAFYDKPPQRQPIPARSEASGLGLPQSNIAAGTSGGGGGTSGLPAGISGFDDSFINSADFTGDSSYEDTCEVLKNLRMMHSSGDMSGKKDHYGAASEVFMGQDKTTENNGGGGGAPGGGGMRDEMSGADLTPPKTDSYEFPAELAKYPLKRELGNPDSQPPKAREEPTLHTFNYSSKPQGSSNLTSSTSVTRHESFSRSSRNMPLPPLPTEVSGQQQHHRQQVDQAPPLPARAISNSGKPPLPGNHPSTRKQHTGDQDPPRLPPLNHPWGNKRVPLDAGTPSSDSNPPLPPRKKDGPLNVEMGGTPSPQPPPQQQRKEDLAFRELVALGYSKAEIDRALKITKNDYSMAKMILQEFGGRH